MMIHTASDILNAKILIVDDKEANVLLLERLLRRAGYTSITTTTASHAVCGLYRQNRYDLILLDMQMPGMDGFRVMEGLNEIELDGYLPVLVITAQPEHKLRALQVGAKDFITKPFDLPEVLTRIHNMLQVRLLHRKSVRHSLVLEDTVQALREIETGLRTTQAVLSDEKAALDDHVDQLQQANETLVAVTLDAQTLTKETIKAKDELEYLAHHDALTGLPNRILLLDRLSKAIELARRQSGQLAVLFMDLDQFKHVNDSLGHGVGDQLLQSVAQRLVACVRQSDTVSRQGGDEFVLLLPHIERAEDAAISAQKILAALTPPHRIETHDLQVGVSIGISVYPGDGQNTDTLLKGADTAMYYAKESGRNNFKFFEKNMHERAVERQSMEASLRLGLERQEFVLHYQPKVDLGSGTILGVEAFIRWQHPTLGLLRPAQFVPVAEGCGLIVPMDRWVLREACRQVQSWLAAGLPPITVAINTSALEFRATDFLDNIRITLDDTGLEPHYLELELTESILMRDPESAISVLGVLADLGVTLAIDDFGTGYSNLSYLKQFPIHTFKIDQSFVSQMTTNPDDANIVSAVIGLGKSLKRRVIAEGVETPEQCALLLAQQCDEGQGYYFSHPMAPEAFATLHLSYSLCVNTCRT